LVNTGQLIVTNPVRVPEKFPKDKGIADNTRVKSVLANRIQLSLFCLKTFNVFDVQITKDATEALTRDRAGTCELKIRPRRLIELRPAR
jgi:hypothetical protein